MNNPNVPGSFKTDDLKVRGSTGEVGGASRQWGAEGHGSGEKSALCKLLQSLFNQFL